MHTKMTALTAAAIVVGFGASIDLRAGTPRPVGAVATMSQATIVAIKGNLVTIADARGNRKTLEVASAAGLLAGAKIDWCEDDCRLLRTGGTTVEVKRVLAVAP